MQARKIPQKSNLDASKKIPQKEAISMQARKSLKRSNLNASKKNPSNWPSLSKPCGNVTLWTCYPGSKQWGYGTRPTLPSGGGPRIHESKRRLQRQGPEMKKRKKKKKKSKKPLKKFLFCYLLSNSKVFFPTSLRKIFCQIQKSFVKFKKSFVFCQSLLFNSI